MQLFFKTILNLIFPPSAEARLVVKMVHDGTIHSLISVQHYRGIVVLSQFKNPLVRALIHEAKFHRNDDAFALLAEMVAFYLASLPPSAETVILPIPLSPQRLRERGYNQVTEVARRALVRKPHFLLDEDTLVRTANTKPQTALARGERLTNVHSAFSVLGGNQLTGKHLIIFDDVVTTGATLEAATAAVLPYKPASILRLAIAH